MSRLVFVAYNASYAHSSLADWTLQAVTDPSEWDWHTVEVIPGDDPLVTLNTIIDLKPDVIAATAYLFNAAPLYALLRRTKTLLPAVRIFLGGPEFLGDNKATLRREPWIDAVVRGEGENSFPILLRHWRKPAQWSAISGLCFVRGNRYYDKGFAQPVKNLDMIPSPYAAHLAGFRKPFIQLETSRGCANTCAFCASAGTQVRYASIERIRSDLAIIQSHGVRQVRLVDRTFNMPPQRCLRLLAIFRDEFPDIRFHLEIDPARVSLDLIKALSTARKGQFHVEAGIQTFQPKVLKAIGRRGHAKAVWRGLEMLRPLESVDLHVDLIAGLPEATEADVIADLNSLMTLRPGTIQLERLKVLPGTRLATESRPWGIVASPEPPYEVLSTATMTPADLLAVHHLSRLVDWYYNTDILQLLISDAARSLPSFWEDLRIFLLEQKALGACPSLENRFKLLDRFFQGRDLQLMNRLRFLWLQQGFSARHGLVDALPWKEAIPADAQLIEGRSDVEGQRKVSAMLDRRYLFVYPGGEGGQRPAVAVYVLP